MAKVKFNLNFGGNAIRSLEELRENFFVEDALDAYRNNELLLRWLESRWFRDELAQVQAIQATESCEILSALIRIFGVEIASVKSVTPEGAALIQGVLKLGKSGARDEQGCQDVEAKAHLGSEEHKRLEIGRMLAKQFIAVCENGTEEEVRLAIEAGADVNVRDCWGKTALMCAAMRDRNPEVITALLDAGADASAKDKDGSAAWDYAQDNDSLKGTDAIRRLDPITAKPAGALSWLFGG